MQILWVNNAYNMKAELLDHKINVALKSIVNQMIEQKYESQQDVFFVHYCKLQEQDIVEHIDPLLLDSIVLYELKSLDINMDYEYAVFRQKDSLFVIGNNQKFMNNIGSCKYTISLSCVSSDDSFYFGIIFKEKKMFLLKQIIVWLLLNLFFFSIIGLSYFKIVNYYIKLKKLYSIKADFINNLTHEFKTPIATISIAGEMLKKSEIINDVQKRNRYHEIIQNENKRLKAQVDQILQIALIEKGELPLNFEIIDTHTLIKECISNFQLVLNEKNGKVITEFNAQNHLVKADKVHFVNIITNLLDNAVKYTLNPPSIKIVTYNENDLIVIKVIDNGLGIPKEYINNVFKQFFRVPKGNVHDIKGFGLGLFYVKTVVDLFNGQIFIESEVHKGSCFKITLFSA